MPIMLECPWAFFITVLIILKTHIQPNKQHLLTLTSTNYQKVLTVHPDLVKSFTHIHSFNAHKTL